MLQSSFANEIFIFEESLSAIRKCKIHRQRAVLFVCNSIAYACIQGTVGIFMHNQVKRPSVRRLEHGGKYGEQQLSVFFEKAHRAAEGKCMKKRKFTNSLLLFPPLNLHIKLPFLCRHAFK